MIDSVNRGSGSPSLHTQTLSGGVCTADHLVHFVVNTRSQARGPELKTTHSRKNPSSKPLGFRAKVLVFDKPHRVSVSLSAPLSAPTLEPRFCSSFERHI